MDKQIVVDANKYPLAINFKEIYQYRELIWTLALRDFKVKYAQTLVGFSWSFINPIVTLIILSFVFGTIAKVDTGNIPHIVFTTAGLCGWTYFASLVEDAGNSIIGSQEMIKKIYFPRLIIPLSKAIMGLIDFIIILLCLFVLMLFYDVPFSSNLIYLPIFILMVIIAGLAGGLWVSALTIRYRDFKYVSPLILRIGMYLTPIAYAASAVPESYKTFYYINPMAGIVEGIRWSLIGGDTPFMYMYLSFAIVIILFISGIFYFKKVEQVMADII